MTRVELVPLPPQARIARSDTAIAAEVADEIVVLNVETGYFHSLNERGSDVWRRLEAPTTFSRLLAPFLDEFDVDAESCARDLTVFLEEMLACGLVSVEGSLSDRTTPAATQNERPE